MDRVVGRSLYVYVNINIAAAQAGIQTQHSFVLVGRSLYVYVNINIAAAQAGIQTQHSFVLVVGAKWSCQRCVCILF